MGFSDIKESWEVTVGLHSMHGVSWMIATISELGLSRMKRFGVAEIRLWAQRVDYDVTSIFSFPLREWKASLITCKTFSSKPVKWCRGRRFSIWIEYGGERVMEGISMVNVFLWFWDLVHDWFGLSTKVLNTVLKAVSVRALEWNISIPVPFRNGRYMNKLYI